MSSYHPVVYYPVCYYCRYYADVNYPLSIRTATSVASSAAAAMDNRRRAALETIKAGAGDFTPRQPATISPKPATGRRLGCCCCCLFLSFIPTYNNGSNQDNNVGRNDQKPPCLHFERANLTKGLYALIVVVAVALMSAMLVPTVQSYMQDAFRYPDVIL